MDEKEIQKKYKDLYRLCVANYLSPEAERLSDYYKAQEVILNSVLILEDQISDLKKSTGVKKSSEIIRIQNRITLFKDFGNTIAWHLIGENETNLRSYFGAGPNNGMLKDKNLESELKIIEEFNDVPNTFIFMCDLTTMINIGDVMIKKVNFPPMTLEMKEGETNKKLMEILHDEESLNKFVESVDPSKRKTTERQIKRLKSQKKRIDHLNAYLRDDSLRYNEEYDLNVMIIKPSKYIKPAYFSNQLNQAYRKLESSDIKTIKIHGGVYALVTNRPENNDDHIHFRHMVYHKINNLNFSSDCMISSDNISSNSSQDELSFLQNAEVYRPLEGLGVGGFKPLPACLEELDEDFALSILNRESSLYFAIDPREFLSNLSRYGMSWELKKSSSLPGEAKGAFLVNGRRVVINGSSALSKNFLERIFRSFHRPSYEIKMIKEMTLRVENITNAEIDRYAKDR